MEATDSDELQERIEQLEQQVDVLAEANARAAELMAELDEARAASSALQRRAEELTLQHNVDAAVVTEDDESRLCSAVLSALTATVGLEITGPCGVFLIDGEQLGPLCSTASVPSEVTEWAFEMLGKADIKDGRWVAVPLIGSQGPLGTLCLHARVTPAWAERWIQLLQSIGQTIGGALERIRIAADLASARDDALAASRAKSRFLANMSHELRTPLNAILGYAEMLRDERDDDDADCDDLDKIAGAGRHLLSLINDILDLSKIEAGRMELYVTPFYVTQLVSDVVATATPLVRRNGNTLRVEVEDVGAMVSDEQKLRQCLLNLLSNAAKFTEQGEITLAVESQDDKLHFAVHDTGIGMAEDTVRTIFDAFTQAETSRLRAGGTGLGLTITRRLCAMMGGDISVQSAPDQGSTFAFWVPRRVTQR